METLASRESQLSQNSCTDLAGVGFNFVAKSKIMKRWAILTVLLYALALLALTSPVVLLAFGNWGKNEMNIGFQDVLKFYSQWAYWLWLAVLVGGQFLLLLLPIDVSERRLPARRKLKIPVIVTAFFLANLFVAGIFCIASVFLHDHVVMMYSFVDWILGHKTTDQPAQTDLTQTGFIFSAIIKVGIFWFFWAIIFQRFAKADDEPSLIKRCTRWLLRGSILELLVAVPSHVIVRRRDDCCAPVGTFWGIATGISVMLLCFGPGVYFLFVERCRKLKPKLAGTDKYPSDGAI